MLYLRDVVNYIMSLLKGKREIINCFTDTKKVDKLLFPSSVEIFLQHAVTLFQLNGGKLPFLLNSAVTFWKLLGYLKFVVLTLPSSCALSLFFQYFAWKRDLFHLCGISSTLNDMSLLSFNTLGIGFFFKEESDLICYYFITAYNYMFRARDTEEG